MIYQDDTGQETWVSCDKCTLTLFGGFTPTNMIDMQGAFKMHGWSFGKRVLCPYCSEEEREIAKRMEARKNVLRVG